MGKPSDLSQDVLWPLEPSHLLIIVSITSVMRSDFSNLPKDTPNTPLDPPPSDAYPYELIRQKELSLLMEVKHKANTSRPRGPEFLLSSYLGPCLHVPSAEIASTASPFLSLCLYPR
jgi:hypothetical protein